jgi:sodium transport system ATP-binding protein
MGVLPDALGLYPRLTAEENIAYFGRLQGLSGAALAARIDALCALLDLTPVRHRRVGGFSQGERMKVALGRALVHDPRTVLLDEPTNGLDVMSTRAVRALIRRLRDDGRCVVFSSHLMAEVAALCDTVVVVARGTVVAAGAPEALRAQAGAATFEEAFVALTGPAPEPA